MAIEQAFDQHLLDLVELANYVGDRIWPLVGESRTSDNDFPCLVVQWTGAADDYALAGATGLVQAVAQLTAFARTLLECQKIVEVLRSDLSGKDDTIGNGPHRTDVTVLFTDIAADDYEPPSEGREFGICSRRAEARVWSTR